MGLLIFSGFTSSLSKAKINQFEYFLLSVIQKVGWFDITCMEKRVISKIHTSTTSSKMYFQAANSTLDFHVVGNTRSSPSKERCDICKSEVLLILCSKSNNFPAVFALADLKSNQIVYFLNEMIWEVTD